MAGQTMELFLTRKSKKCIHKYVQTTTKSGSLLRDCFLQRFLLTLLLLQSCLIHYAAAFPAAAQAPNNTPVIDDSSSRPNNYVDIAKINEQLGLFQGDMKLSSQQQSIYEIITTRNFYPQTPLPEKMVEYWADGFIYYDTSTISDTRLLAMIELAISTLNRETNCLILIPGRPNSDYIKFTKSPGSASCWSFLGKQGGPQPIELGSESCRNRNVIMHLIFHALGFVHEETRPDRDLYVEINFNNIIPGKVTNFAIISEEIAHTYGINYNYNSLMHSSKRSSSYLTSTGYKNTIRPRGRLSTKNFGSTNSLTPGDITRVNALYCPFNVQTNRWTEWSVWSSCSVSCNSGVKNRTRICRKPDVSHVCPGGNFEIKRCHKRACPVLSSWGQWGEWSKCSAVCGGGRQVRVKQCVGGDVCAGGKGRQYRSCGRYRCPGSRWHSWSQWSACSQSCRYGRTSRTRRCPDNTCVGQNRKTKICNYNIPCSPVWSQWSNWTVCTEGRVARTRSCRLPPYRCKGPHTEYLNCDINGSRTDIPLTTSGKLETTGSWTTWSPCSSSCGPGTQERSNSCGKLGECRQMIQIIILLSFLYLFPHIFSLIFQI